MYIRKGYEIVVQLVISRKVKVLNKTLQFKKQIIQVSTCCYKIKAMQ